MKFNVQKLIKGLKRYKNGFKCCDTLQICDKKMKHREHEEGTEKHKENRNKDLNTLWSSVSTLWSLW